MVGRDGVAALKAREDPCFIDDRFERRARPAGEDLGDDVRVGVHLRLGAQEMANDLLRVLDIGAVDSQLDVKAAVTEHGRGHDPRIIGGSDHKDILTLDHINEGLHGHTYSSA